MLLDKFNFNCGDFADGPNTNYPMVLTTALGDGNDGAAQSVDINITLFLMGQITVRCKNVANGNWNNGPAVALTLGLNFKSVAAVQLLIGFTVKFQFSSGDVEFDLLVVNSDESSCTATSSQPATAVSNCEAFDDGPNNDTWLKVLTAALTSDGPSSFDAQSLT